MLLIEVLLQQDSDLVWFLFDWQLKGWPDRQHDPSDVAPSGLGWARWLHWPQNHLQKFILFLSLASYEACLVQTPLTHFFLCSLFLGILWYGFCGTTDFPNSNMPLFQSSWVLLFNKNNQWSTNSICGHWVARFLCLYHWLKREFIIPWNFWGTDEQNWF